MQFSQLKNVIPTYIKEDLKYYFFAFLVSTVSMFAQVGFLRVSARVFHGNELTVGMITGHWLLWTSLGAYLGSILVEKFSIHNLLQPLTVIYSLVILIFTNLLYLIRPILNISNSIILNTGQIFLISLTLLALPILINGMLWPLIVNFIKNKSNTARVSWIYSADVFGAAWGALAFGILISLGVKTFYNLHIAVLFFLIITKLFYLEDEIKYFRMIFGIIIFIIATVFFIRSAEKVRWKPMQIQNTYETPYQSVVEARYQEEKVIFGNGEVLPLGEDKSYAEELIHFPMLAHFSPDSVLFIGNIDSTIHSEIQKYNRVSHITILNEDRELQNNIYPLSDTLNNINYINGDPFQELARIKSDYDVLILNISRPINILWNRYYTKKFFKDSKKVLNSEGLIALSLPGGENYLSEAQVRFLNIIGNTVKTSFDHLNWIPGETIHLIGGNREIDINYETFSRKIDSKDINNKYITDHYLIDRLSSMKIDFLHQNLNSIEEGSINTLLNPLAFYFNTILQEQKGSSIISKIYKRAKSINSLWIILGITLLGILFLFTGGRSPMPLFMMGIVGFYHLILENLIIILYQSFVGAIYLKLTFLLFSFMIGAGLGAIYYQKKTKLQGKIFFLGLFLLPILILILIKLNLFLSLLFPVLLFISGFIDGYLFPYLLGKYNKNADLKSGSSAGRIYSADVMGSCLGGYLFSLFLIPIWGINIVIAILASLGLLLLAKEIFSR